MIEMAKKMQLTTKVIITILTCICGGYSIIRRQDYFGSSKLFHMSIIIAIYTIIIVAIWWKNRIGEKKQRIVSGVLFCATPLICYLLVECANSQWSALFVEGAGLSIKNHFLNLMIYAAFALVVFCLTSSTRAASVISYAFFAILGAAMHYVCIFRGMGFVATDFYSIGAAKEVAFAYDFSPDYWMYISLSLALMGIAISLSFNGRITVDRKGRLLLLLGAVFVCTSFYVVNYKLPYTKHMKVKLYKPQETYVKKGAALTFVQSFKYIFIEEPEGYSIQEVKRIAGRYQKNVETATTSRKETPNLILIMNESFCDVEDLSNGVIETNEEVLPITKSLIEDTVKGTLHEERRGGGTSIMEFEALTGNTNAFFPIGTMAYQTLIHEETPSLASQLTKHGFQGIIASHPHNSSGYNRINAYPLIGFKTTKFREAFDTSGNNGLYGRYVSDAASYQEIIDDYERYTADSDDPFFAFQVTMQNHAPYDSAENRDIKIVNEEFYDDSVEQYLNYAHESDKQIGRLIEYFKREEDPTLVVIFGDHAPRFDTEYYKKILGTTDNLNDEQEMQFQKTPLIMWANYDIEEENIGDTSDNYISSRIADLLGIEKTGYQKFLDDLRESVPVINSLGYWGSNGRYYNIYDKESPYYNIVHEYNLLVYNQLVDTNNRIDEFFE